MTYKVVQWATGSVGMWSLKEIVRNPDLDLVGLRVYSPDKVGRDAGEIAGTDPVGVIATDSTAEILALDCDAVVHCAQAFGQMEQMTDDVVALLESGKNVVSVSDYISPDLWRPGLLVRAARRGRQARGRNAAPDGDRSRVPLRPAAGDAHRPVNRGRSHPHDRDRRP
jgi:hypothetical protein